MANYRGVRRVDYAKYSKKAKETNPFDYWRWGVFGFLLITGIVIITRIGKNGLFGGAFSLSNDSGYSDGSGDILGSGGSGTTIGNDTNLAGDSINGTNTLQELEDLTDLIYENTANNWIYYPEIINRIANLNDADLWRVIQFWNTKYKIISGNTLYHQIASEWTNYYAPALARIEQSGWENS